jgi:uncharacterized membrane protein
MNKNDLIFYIAITAINLIVYVTPYVLNKEIGAPLYWVEFILFPSLAVCAIYEYWFKNLNNKKSNKKVCQKEKHAE